MPSRRVQGPAQRLNLLEVPRQHEYLGTWCKHVPWPASACPGTKATWFCLFTVRTRLFPALSAHRQLLAVPSQYNDSRHGHGRRCSLRVSSRFWLRLCHAHVRGVRGGVLQAGSGNTSCSACPAFSSSPVAATHLENCTCLEGFEGPPGGPCECPAGEFLHNASATCHLCHSGTYKPQPGNGLCLPCTNHSNSSAGAVNSTECICLTGFSAPRGPMRVVRRQQLRGRSDARLRAPSCQPREQRRLGRGRPMRVRAWIYRPDLRAVCCRHV